MIDETGYVRPTYDELLTLRIEEAKEFFGDDIDTSNSSPLGKYIRLGVKHLAEAFEGQEQIYYARFPHTATGQSLDRLMPFANISRNAATRAEHEIRLQGTPGYEVPAGFLVGTKGDETFFLVNPVVLDYGGVGYDCIVQCTEFGTVGNVPLGAITEIINPDANVKIVEHINIESLGEDKESDVDLRNRFDMAIEGSSSGTALAIRGAVMRVNGVRSCIVTENDTDSVDGDGRPPHSFEVYVHAPESARLGIAEAIYSKKPLGVPSYGTSSETITDVQGNDKVVYFTPVADTSLYIRLEVATDDEFELDGVEQIKTALMSYVNGLKAGEDVIYTNLYRYIHSVNGVKDTLTLTLSTNGSSYTVGNVTANKGEVIVLDTENISIEVSAYADR
ncbi:MAG: baseplate J/gp47 family protein [Paludibacteraceae bacterium]|nr:baseplate J/gp47 family protein [Paludibacteraceae bacterium]